MKRLRSEDDEKHKEHTDYDSKHDKTVASLCHCWTVLIPSYTMSSYSLKVKEFVALTTSQSVSQYTWYKANNVWSGLKHSGRALTWKFEMLVARFLSCSVREVQCTIDWSCVACTYRQSLLSFSAREEECAHALAQDTEHSTFFCAGSHS